MERKTIGYVELIWSCPGCSTRNTGSDKTCAGCGAAQPAGVKFERSADEQLVRDPTKLQQATAGADLLCPYCTTRNSATAKVCSQCGGDLTAAKRRASGAELEASSGPAVVPCPSCGATNRASASRCDKCGSPLGSQPRGRQGAKPDAGRRRRGWVLPTVVATALVFFVGASYLFLFPRGSVRAIVVQSSWHTTVPVEKLTPVQHRDEAGPPPSGAYDVACRTETRQVCTEKVIDTGTGFGQKVQDCKDESQQYCSYATDEWQVVQTVVLDGTDALPLYAQPTLTSGQRLGATSVNLKVVFDAAGEEKAYSPSGQEEFARLRPGTEWTLLLNTLGGILSVAP